MEYKDYSFWCDYTSFGTSIGESISLAYSYVEFLSTATTGMFSLEKPHNCQALTNQISENIIENRGD